MTQSHFYQEETFLTALIYIIKEANEILREERSPTMTIEEKIDSNGRKSKVTSGDLKTNEFIMKRLQEINQTLSDDNIGFYNIISEEIAEAPFEERNSRLIDGSWCVDPLDGTADYCNFELETPSYTCNIGLIIDGDPVFGIVSVPETGVIYYGIKGVGSYKIDDENRILYDGESMYPGRKIQVDPNKDLKADGVRVAASASHLNHETKAFIDSKLNNQVCKYYASSLKLCAVAEGEVDIYPRCGPTCEWDTCAADAVVRYAGGGVYIYNPALELDEYRDMLKYNKPYLLNPHFIVF